MTLIDWIKVHTQPNYIDTFVFTH